MTESYDHSDTSFPLRGVFRDEGVRRGDDGDAPAYDALGIGFGPSNLSLAIALDEAGRRRGRQPRVRFLERQDEFVWHGGMLLPDSGMQISFLKDLVTLRDPTSPYTFVNYLHVHGRLIDYINRKSFFPSRIEFNAYLRWVAGHFADRCDYGDTVLAVEPEGRGDTIRHLLVHSRKADGREQRRRTRAVILATGGEPRILPVFEELHGSARIFHSSRYLSRIDGVPLPDGPTRHPRIAVIGAGQTAAELFLDLQSRIPNADISMIFRGQALKPADDSPFVNEIFNPDFTDFVYGQPETQRRAIIDEFRGTNYSVIDTDLLTRIFDILYQQKVSGKHRHALRPRTTVVGAVEQAGEIVLETLDAATGLIAQEPYDAVILATGYRRDRLETIMPSLAPHLTDGTIGRDYRLATRPGFEPGIYLQGFSEPTHGLSDTLLSILVMRGHEIAQSLLADRQRVAARA
ncbi:lysine N(6)-hydroxylase/L-ornithine N(5)-oxygenase family protein [Methylobacterium sp. 10]|uniref:lysine N(6)-hydroxylase/L-ornithine N(5)-oxygenase family protein n=1 Tax=Methylobacterium sp. 10 TaxID=1101191 RepID=UPI000486EFF5|nr:lysine N(6)-hydroxylase/L-ornithine N(5)-oxygenase family protein [Methylobacterium sp. 10]